MAGEKPTKKKKQLYITFTIYTTKKLKMIATEESTFLSHELQQFTH